MAEDSVKALSITKMLRERGVSGTKNFAGIISDEYLPQLSFYNAPHVYNQMRRSDGTIAALLAAYTMPLRSAKWYIQPFDESPLSLEMADFYHDNLWGFGTQTFDDFLREALTFLPYGFSWFEKIFSYMNDPNSQFKGKIGWDHFAFRYQNTRFRYNTDVYYGPGGSVHRRLKSITQLAPPDYQLVEIPVDKIVIFSHQKEGDNYDGISLLRPVYKHWYIKEQLYKIQSIGLERSSVGVPYAKYLQHVDQDTINVITQMIENLRVDDQASIQFDGNEVEIGYLVNKFQSNEVALAIEHHDTKILQSGLAQFVNLGTRSTGTTGSYSLSQDQSQMFLDALNGEANYFASAFHLQAAQQLMAYNYMNVSRGQYPRLSHGDIGERASATLSQALNAFAQYGFITPDPHTENVIREFLDLPPRDEDYHEMIAEQALNQTPYPGGDDPTKRDQTPIPTTVPPNDKDLEYAKLQSTGKGATPQIGKGIKGGAGKQMGSKTTGRSRKGLTGAPFGPKQRGGLAAHEYDVQNYEQVHDMFMSELESLKKSSVAWQPERPSVKAARLRRPYEIRG